MASFHSIHPHHRHHILYCSVCMLTHSNNLLGRLIVTEPNVLMLIVVVRCKPDCDTLLILLDIPRFIAVQCIQCFTSSIQLILYTYSITLNLNLMTAACFKQTGTGKTKDSASSIMLKKPVFKIYDVVQRQVPFLTKCSTNLLKLCKDADLCVHR